MTEMKPVLLTVGSPLTVVMSAVESAVKNVSPIPLRGPVGGLTCPRLKGRRVSKLSMPLGEKDAQEMPARAPVCAAQTMLRAVDTATELGKSPIVMAGWPRRVSLVGSWGEMQNMETEFEPALTAKRNCGRVRQWWGE